MAFKPLLFDERKRALKGISGFEIKPIDMEARVRTAYKFFADEDMDGVPDVEPSPRIDPGNKDMMEIQKPELR